MSSRLLVTYAIQPRWRDDAYEDADADIDEEIKPEIAPAPEPEPEPDLKACPKWLRPWAAKIVQMRADGLTPGAIAWRVEPLVDRHYREQGEKRLEALKSDRWSLINTYRPPEYARGAKVSPKEVSDALWLMDAGRLPDPPKDRKYHGFLRPFVGKILQMHAAGCGVVQIQNWVREYQSHVDLGAYGYHNWPPSKSNIKYVLRRELLPPKPPKRKKVVHVGPSDVEVYEDTLDCVYAGWAAEHARAWRNRSRPIDMGGPRGVWIDDLPWEAR